MRREGLSQKKRKDWTGGEIFGICAIISYVGLAHEYCLPTVRPKLSDPFMYKTGRATSHTQTHETMRDAFAYRFPLTVLYGIA